MKDRAARALVPDVTSDTIAKARDECQALLSAAHGRSYRRLSDRPGALSATLRACDVSCGLLESDVGRMLR